MSDIVIALLMSVVGINVVILLMLFIKNILENITDTLQSIVNLLSQISKLFNFR